MLCTGAMRVVLPKNTVIMKENDYNTCLYRIKSGRIRIEKVTWVGDAQQNVVLTTLEKNQVFGEMSFVEDTWDMTASLVSVGAEYPVFITTKNYKIII